LLLLALAPYLGAIALAACADPAEPELCGEIQEGGCPIGRGGTCDDAACLALYDCVEGAWTLVERCGRSGGGGDGGVPDGDGTDDACAPVVLDHSGEATGCRPSLQHPDCPVEAVETCAASACATGCLDFFLCTRDGWTGVAYCTEEGQIVVTQ
jgi:hypothetical protein